MSRDIIDFTNCDKNPYKIYGGANGSKIGIIYEGEKYMLKFPPEAKINKEISYSNSTVSEYIGCKVFEIMGIKVQETLLGIYHHKGKPKIVVACKDVEENGYRLKDFASLKNTIIDSVRGGYGTELEDILQTIDEQNLISPKKLNEFFWDMFIVDSFIGNFDRHNGNWGFLINEELLKAKIAPIYDCGSCLFAEMDIDKKIEVMQDKDELEYRLYTIPKSAIMMDRKKIPYYDFIKSDKNKECTEALLRFEKKIDMNRINDMIDEISVIGETEKEFYKYMLKARKENMLDLAKKHILSCKVTHSKKSECVSKKNKMVR